MLAVQKRSKGAMAFMVSAGGGPPSALARQEQTTAWAVIIESPALSVPHSVNHSYLWTVIWSNYLLLSVAESGEFEVFCNSQPPQVAATIRRQGCLDSLSANASGIGQGDVVVVELSLADVAFCAATIRVRPTVAFDAAVPGGAPRRVGAGLPQGAQATQPTGLVGSWHWGGGGTG